MSVVGILGKKVGMTQIFDDRGDVHPVTVLKAALVRDHPDQDAGEGRLRGCTDRLRRFREGIEGEQGHDRPLRQGERSARAHDQRKPALEAVKGENGENTITAKAGDRILVDIFNDEPLCRRHRYLEGPWFRGCYPPPWLRRRSQVARSHVPGAGLDRRFVVPLARLPGPAHAWAHGPRPGYGAGPAIRGIDLEDNLILVEGAVPGPRDGFVLISKAKAPPRERRGFAGAATKDALKASKKAAPKKK